MHLQGVEKKRKGKTKMKKEIIEWVKVIVPFTILTVLVVGSILGVMFFGYPPVWVSILMLVPMALVIVKNVKETL